uniref:Uncharacterized protein n=1 Tax=Setaria viridis TaxID=4556 RepID=A0A4U6VIV6_SETVI|nr:hypothetical protein SEVIR_3G033750v2 [Setaria viridis]
MSPGKIGDARGHLLEIKEALPHADEVMMASLGGCTGAWGSCTSPGPHTLLACALRNAAAGRACWRTAASMLPVGAAAPPRAAELVLSGGGNWCSRSRSRGWWRSVSSHGGDGAPSLAALRSLPTPCSSRSRPSRAVVKYSSAAARVQGWRQRRGA